jgi:hypothetical protein
MRDHCGDLPNNSANVEFNPHEAEFVGNKGILNSE